MGLSNDLISQFSKVTVGNKNEKKESIVYGTVTEYNGSLFVKLDGSDLLTPMNLTTDAKDGDRITVLVKNHSVTTIGNLTSPSVSNAQLNDAKEEARTIFATQVYVTDTLRAYKGEFDSLYADRAEFETIKASVGRFDQIESTIVTTDILNAGYATIGSLQAVDAKFNTLSSTYATITQLTAVEAKIDNLDVGDLSAITARIETLETHSLTADSAIITTLKADIASIDTLIFGSASGNVIQSSFSNAVIAQLGDARIKSAMIESVSASKITAGDIITNNVRVKSEDGSLLISDETIQISDDTRVRVQIGKDASNDYSINIWDQNGNLMFSEGGITDKAIKDAIIRNDMVSDTANISASKLDIDSLFEEINGSSNTIKSTKVYLDEEGQTLDVSFKQMTTDVGKLGDDVSSQGTQLSVVQGQIESKIWQQDITTATDPLGKQINTLSTDYSVLNQTVSGLSETVGSHTTQIANKADNSTVTTVSNKVSELETSLDGFKSTVSETYATITHVNNAITEGIDGIQIGGRNLAHSTYIVQAYGQSGESSSQNGYRWSNVKASQYSGTYIDGSLFSVGETYTLSYRFKKTSGTLINIGGHAGGTTSISFYLDGVKQTSDYTAGKTLGDDGTEHYVVFTFTVDNAANFTHVYIQPNRGHTTVIGFDIWDIQLEKGNKATDWVAPPEDIESRMSTAETAIDQNKEAITLRATKTEVETVNNKFINYSTTSQMNAAIETKATGILSTVSSTYPTKTEFNNLGTRVSTVEQTATGLTVRLDATDSNIANNYAKKTLPDTRNDNQSPLWYMQNYPSQVVTEFKLSTVIGLSSPAETYCTLTTTIPWPDKSGGYPKQNAKIGNKEFWRYGTSDTVWSSWSDALGSASNAQSTANTANSTANTALSNANAAQTTANTARSEAANAAKTATNYLSFSNGGLVVGNMTASTLGRNVLIDTDSVDIRNGTTVLASFAENEIKLGLATTSSKIYFGDVAEIYANSTTGTTFFDQLFITAKNLIIRGDSASIDTTTQFSNTGQSYSDSAHGSVSVTSYYSTSSSYSSAAMRVVEESTGTVALVNTYAGKNNSYVELSVDGSYYTTLRLTDNHLSYDGATASFKRISVDSISCTDGINVALGSTSSFGGYVQVENDLIIDADIDMRTNDSIIYGTSPSGVLLNCLQPQNYNGNVLIGHGPYTNKSGNTHIYGNDVQLASASAGNVMYRPYWRKGDTINVYIRTSGYMTNSSKDVYFVIPLSKPIIGTPTISVSSINGFIIRYNGKYTHGSSSETYVTPASYSAYLNTLTSHSNDEHFIQIKASFTDTTNCSTNNTVGIMWSGTITLS